MRIVTAIVAVGIAASAPLAQPEDDALENLGQLHADLFLLLRRKGVVVQIAVHYRCCEILGECLRLPDGVG